MESVLSGVAVRKKNCGLNLILLTLDLIIFVPKLLNLCSQSEIIFCLLKLVKGIKCLWLGTFSLKKKTMTKKTFITDFQVPHPVKLPEQIIRHIRGRHITTTSPHRMYVQESTVTTAADFSSFLCL